MVLLGCAQTTTPKSQEEIEAAQVAAAGGPTPPVRAADLIKKPDQRFTLIQHLVEAETDYYYIKTTTTTWRQLKTAASQLPAKYPGSFGATPPGPLGGEIAAKVSESSPAVSAQSDAAAPASLDDITPSATESLPSEAAVEVDGAASNPGDAGRHLRHSRRQLQMTDNRYRITTTTAAPYWNYGRILFKKADQSSWICSGTFISPDDVVTAGHCVIDSASGSSYSGFTFIPGLNGATEPYGR